MPRPALAQAAGAGPAEPVPAVNTEALGISMAKIKRRLAADSRARTQGSTPLKLEYRVDVFGTRAGATLLRRTGSASSAAVPSSAPTHADMLYMFTPQAFRSPRVDFLGLAVGAASAGAKKVQDWRYLRDLRNYQSLVESGVNVPAPAPPKP